MESDRVVIRFLPTVYSFTANRCGEIPGTAELRVRSSEILTGVLKHAGLDHAYETFHGDTVIAREVVPPPIEVIVKGRHVGTPKHRYYGMSNWPTLGGGRILDGAPYSHPWVRFDWRNPLPMADEVLPEPLASQFIDVDRAKLTAMRAWSVLSKALLSVGIELVDICLFIDASGDLIFGELSPDCARFRYHDHELDKDVWRNGGSSELVLERWAEFVRRIEGVVC